jgi:hypothetical protein
VTLNKSDSGLLSIDRRKFRATALVLSFWLVVSNLAAAPCSKTSTQQDLWVARRVNALVRAAHAAYEDEDDDGPGRRSYERVLDRIAATIKRCRLGEDRDFVSRYPAFVEYVKLLSLSRNEDHELGFEVSDEVYFTETSEHTAIPDFLLTPLFLGSVSRFETLSVAKALLREMNAGRAADDQLLFFSYTSRHLGTPDNPDSYRRLLIVVPGNVSQRIPEKWVQFGITDPRARTLVRNVSVVAVLPGPDQTSNVYFKDYFRTYRRNGSIKIKGRWEMGYGDDNCVGCHKSGVLPIFPVDGSVSRDDRPVLEAVNERFLTYGPPRFDRYLDASKFGPGLGSMRPVRPPSQADSQLPSQRGGGAGDPDPGDLGPGELVQLIRSKTTRKAFNTTTCASCHQPDRLGALNWPMDSVLIGSFVTGGQMPLGAKLQDSDRAALYEQLIEDYFAIDDARPGILKAWLLGKGKRQ